MTSAAVLIEREHNKNWPTAILYISKAWRNRSLMKHLTKRLPSASIRALDMTRSSKE